MTTPNKGTILVTGAGTGIGKALALRLDRAGYHVFAGVLRAKEGDRLRAESSCLLTPLILDITDQGHISQALEAVKSSLDPNQGLLGLVNNAASIVLGPLEFVPLDQLRRQFEVNIIGQIAVTQAFLDLIRKGHGRIINIGTAGWSLSFPFLGPYTASKAAIAVMTNTLRRELQPWRIPVLLVEPGVTATPMWEDGFTAADKLTTSWTAGNQLIYSHTFAIGFEIIKKLYRRAMPAETAAEVIHHALEASRPKLHYSIGLHAQLGAVAGKLLPQRFIDWVNSRVMV